MKVSLAYILVFVFSTISLCAQVYDEDDLEGAKYLEDQFYIATAYNFLLDRPTDVVQRSLSYNLQAGFVKDIPINKRRNVALGIGLGYATNSYYTNIEVTENDGLIGYTITDGGDFVRSKFETHALELPFEFRWRTSTNTEYKFWRIYTGFKLAYVFARSSKLVTENNTNSFTNDDIQDLQYGVMLNFGFNTWNIHAYYALNSLLEDGVSLENGASLNMGTLRIGLIFYIL